MKRIFAALIVTIFAAQAVAAAGDDEVFENLAAQFVSDLPRLSPIGATWIGDHSADAELDQVDAAARATLLAAYREYLEALADIDREQLSRANQVDFELLSAEVKSRLWSLETLQEWAWNPVYFVNRAGSSIYNLVARDFAPIEDRLANAASRLEQFPRFLEQARASIEPQRVPKIHAETAVAQNLGVVSIIETMIVPEMDALTAATRVRLEAAIEIAKDALADHQTWLEEELLPRAAGDFRIGAQLFDTKLAFTLDSPMSRREVQARAEAEYEALRNQMYEVSKEVYVATHPYTAFPDDPDEACTDR